MLNYKKEIPAMTDLLALYSSVGWTNYTNNPTMLEEAVKASLWQLAVYDEKELVAYIRLVGDGYSVIFVQDLLVRPVSRLCRTFRASLYRDDLYEIESGTEIGNSLEFDFVVPPPHS